MIVMYMYVSMTIDETIFRLPFHVEKNMKNPRFFNNNGLRECKYPHLS